MNKLMRWWTAFVINSLTSEKFLKTDILLKKTSDISDNYPSIVWTHWIPFRVICWMEGRYSLGRPPVCCRAITPQSESSSNWESSFYLYFWTPTQRTARVWTWAFSLYLEQISISVNLSKRSLGFKTGNTQDECSGSAEDVLTLPDMVNFYTVLLEQFLLQHLHTTGRKTHPRSWHCPLRWIGFVIPGNYKHKVLFFNTELNEFYFCFHKLLLRVLFFLPFDPLLRNSCKLKKWKCKLLQFFY